MQCYHCGKKGHLARVCRNEKKKTTNGPVPGAREPKSRPTHLVKDIAGEDDVYVESMYQIQGENKVKAYEVTLELCGEPHKFEIDTGATRTVLNEQTYVSCVTNWN